MKWGQREPRKFSEHRKALANISSKRDIDLEVLVCRMDGDITSRSSRVT